MGHFTWQDRWDHRIDRWLQLLRGRLLRWRGARCGIRFGVGPGVRIVFPGYLTVGNDVTIMDYSYLHCLSEGGVHIGNSSSIDRNLWLHCGGMTGPQLHGFFELGEHSYIGCNAVIGAGGGIRIGNNVLVGQSVNFHAESHIYQDPERMISEQGVSYQGIVIEDDVWIGSKAMILDGVTVGRGAVIGGGSVVNRSVPEYAVAVGVPAKVIRSRRGVRV